MQQKDYFSIVGIRSNDINDLQESAKKPVFTIDLLARDDFSEQDGFYVADPFVFSHNKQTHIFCEVLTKNNKGFIGKYLYDSETNTVSSPEVVLEEDFHLSYPQIIRFDGEIYMLPETGEAGDVRLYKAVSENLTDWQYHSSLLDGVFYDTTALFHNGRWYLFTCSKKDFSVMHIFTSETLVGDWKEHSMSPFVQGSGSSRAAGPILKVNDKLYRLAQDCRIRYGQAVRAYEIQKLTEHEYVEEFYSVLLREGEDGYNALGMHHLQHFASGDEGSYFVADGYKRL